MLRSVRLGGFKSHREVELRLAPLTVLIGANASGKSNALEGLRLLSWIGQGNRLAGIRHVVGSPEVRGTLESLGYNGEKTFRLGCTLTGATWNDFEIALRLGEDGDLHVAHERVTGPDEKVPLYETIGKVDVHGSDVRVAYNNFARGGKKPQIVCNDGVAMLSQLESAARFEGGHTTAQTVVPKVCAEFRSRLSEILFLDPQPTTMRGYSYKSEPRLNEDGSNLSGVLYRLTQTEYDWLGDESGRRPSRTRRQTTSGDTRLSGVDERRAAVLNLVRSLPEQNIGHLSFIETPRQEVMLQLRETFGDVARDRDATVLSDGTLRVLAIAAAILSAPAGAFVVIEEIDNGIHPSRAEGIVRGISDMAKARDQNVLISSHNPALLDALPDDAIPHVVFCYRDPTDGSSRLVRLEDLPDYPELIAQGTLGHLLTRGLIDRFAKNQSDPEAKKKRGLDWLEHLRAEVG